MIRNRIEELVLRVERSTTLSAENKAELLGALAELRQEAEALPATAASGAPIAEEQIVRQEEESGLNSLLDDLNASVAGLESSHPRLTALANRVAVVLSNMGI